MDTSIIVGDIADLNSRKLQAFLKSGSDDASEEQAVQVVQKGNAAMLEKGAGSRATFAEDDFTFSLDDI
jgi:hypothetical protein